MLIINSLKLIFSFWKFGAALSCAVPIVFSGALLMQLFLFSKLKRKWLVLAIFLGISLLCQLSVWMIAAAMGKNAVGLAMIGGMILTFSMTVVLGCSLGLLVRRWMIHK